MRPITINMFAVGVGGVPSAGTVAQPSTVPWETYEHTITDQGGFESATATLQSTLADALTNWIPLLMANTIVTGPETQLLWNGYLSSVQVSVGSEQLSVTLDDVATRVRVRYTTVLGTQVTTATASNSTAVNRFGTKDYVQGISTANSTEAQALRDRILSERAWPVPSITSQVAFAQSGGAAAQVTLGFTGWYYTLGWVLFGNTSTTNTATTTQVTNMLTTYNSTNNFFSTSGRAITASGLSASEYAAPESTYREAIEDLLNRGNSSGQKQYWGLFDTDRAMTIGVSAFASPSTITYRRNARANTLVGVQTGGQPAGLVLPWDVRPNAMVETVDFLDITALGGTVPLGIARRYISRVSCRVERGTASVTLEPATYHGTDALIAQLGG